MKYMFGVCTKHAKGQFVVCKYQEGWANHVCAVEGCTRGVKKIINIEVKAH